MVLSLKAREILRIAIDTQASAAKGMIYVVPNDLGPGLIIGGGHVVDSLQTDRDEWLSGLKELASKGLVDQDGETGYRVNKAGNRVALDG